MMTPQLRAFWESRQPRERVFLLALAIIIGVALLAQLLWVSYQARVRLNRQIPYLQQQVEAMQRRAADLQRMRSQPPGPAPVGDSGLLAAAVASANAAGLPDAAKQLRNEGPGRLRLRTTVPFDQWLRWVAAMQRDGRIRIVSCRIEAGAAPGQAKVDALFGLPDSG